MLEIRIICNLYYLRGEASIEYLCLAILQTLITIPYKIDKNHMLSYFIKTKKKKLKLKSK